MAADIGARSGVGRVQVLRRSVVLSAVCVVGLVVALPQPATGATPSAAAPPTSASEPGWQLSTTSASAAAAAPAYVGNGYVGTRVPADGAGFVAAPIAAETHVAGVYADVPDLTHGGIQRQGSVNLPGWTQLDVLVDGQRFTAAGASAYRQILDLHRGIVTTTATWAAGDRTTDVTYDVTLDRSRQRVGVVRLRVTPHWSGALQVRDVLGAGSDLTPGGLRPVASSATARAAVLSVRAQGTGTTVVEAARLDVPAGVSVRSHAAAMSTTRTATLRVRSGQTYEVSKVVGVATSVDSGNPGADARAAAFGAPSAERIVTESAAAWNRLWQSDIRVPGQPELQRRVRAAMFYLLASARADVDWSISPVGLSAGGYNDHVFWDAETWMYPAMLAQHPAEASTVVDYRYRTRDGAARNASSTGYDGLRFAWESAQTGDEVTPTWAETGHLEQHVTADVALAQWQYYLATGDLGWLRSRGWPVIRGAAEFWASRAEARSGGRYSITQIEGPDEENWPVDDEVYTNATARRTLELAGRAAALVGESAPPEWARVAAGLLVQNPQPLGGSPAVRPEFRGYQGQQVKQADAVLLTYPWEFPQPAVVDRSDLEYYTPRYDPDGPAMTDSVNSIVAAQLSLACSDWTYTMRSVDPFVKTPYEQFTEARSGQGVFTFLTGEGGFLQEFLYGYPGLRWDADGIRLDPTLPPQLSRGLTLTGLRWQGRMFDVAVGADRTTVTLRSGAPMRVTTPGGATTISAGTPLVVATRSSATSATDLAQCRPVRAQVTTADPSLPPEAAVDGSTVTAWSPASDPATPSRLTVTLAAVSTVRSATLAWQDARPLVPYTLQVRTEGTWRTVATVRSHGGMTDEVTFRATRGDAVRLLLPPTRYGGHNPRLAELEVAS